MPFSVNITFDEPEDIYNLIERLTMPDTRLGIVLTQIAALEKRILDMSGTMQTTLTELRASFVELKDAGMALKTLLTGLPDVIQAKIDEALAAGASEAQVAALVEFKNELAAQVDEIAADVLAGTPIDPNPEPQPVDPPFGSTTISST